MSNYPKIHRTEHLSAEFSAIKIARIGKSPEKVLEEVKALVNSRPNLEVESGFIQMMDNNHMYVVKMVVKRELEWFPDTLK